MNRKIWGFVTPFLVTGLSVYILFQTSIPDAIKWGILVGLLVALVQTAFSIASMFWAIRRKIFYWVWGGGVLFRMVVFAATAFVIYKYTALSLAAALVTLALATMVLMVAETSILFWEKKRK